MDSRLIEPGVAPAPVHDLSHFDIGFDNCIDNTVVADPQPVEAGIETTYEFFDVCSRPGPEWIIFEVFEAALDSFDILVAQA